MVKRAMTAVAILAGGVLAPAAAAGAAPPSEGTVDSGTPCTMRVSPVFQPVIQQLLASSPTFRAQMQRIANAPHVRVSVEPAVGGVGGCCTLARTVFQRYSEGALIARVEVAFPLTAAEYAELLGHEFEHIVEQIDRLDVAALARDGIEASRIGDNTFETRRAARAGRAIAREAEQAGRESPDRIRQGLDRVLTAIWRVVGRQKRAEGPAWEGSRDPRQN